MAEEDKLRLSPVRFEDPAYQSCYAYWLRLKEQSWAPSWRQWRWTEVSAELIPYFVVVDVTYDPVDFTYRFWGTANTNMHGIDLTHKSISDIRSPVTAKNTSEQYTQVVESRATIGSLHQMQTVTFLQSHSQLALRMPMSNDGTQVDQIVSFIDWRRSYEQIKNEHKKIYGA